MKFTPFFFGCLALTSVAFANYVGNPQAPAIPKIVSYTKGKPKKETSYWLNARLDYEKEYMNNMNLEFTSGGVKQRTQNASYNGNYLTLTANILKHIDLYVKGGTVQPTLDYASTSAFGITSHRKTNTKTIPAWAVGAKFMLFRVKKAAVAVEASYFQTDHRSVLLFPVTPPITPVHNSLSWYNWQVSMGLSYMVCPFIPYMGAKYSRTILTLNPSTPALQVDPTKMDNRRQFGLFFGCSLLPSKYVELNIEGRLIDENSVSGTLGFRF